jgi:hypothetical protein
MRACVGVGNQRADSHQFDLLASFAGVPSRAPESGARSRTQPNQSSAHGPTSYRVDRHGPQGILTVRGYVTCGLAKDRAPGESHRSWLYPRTQSSIWLAVVATVVVLTFRLPRVAFQHRPAAVPIQKQQTTLMVRSLARHRPSRPLLGEET